MNPSDTIDQKRFIRTVRQALGLPPEGRKAPEGLFLHEADPEALQSIHTSKTRTRESRLALLDLLTERAGPIKLDVTAVEDAEAASLAIARVVRETKPEWDVVKSVTTWKHPLVDRLDLPRVLADSNVPVFTACLDAPQCTGELAEESRVLIRERVIKSCIGVTAADYCVADTATLVMRTRPGQPRIVSLLPSIHIAVITLDQILANLGELYALLRWDAGERGNEGLTNCMTMISGPSKTADIELSMIHGAHGPRELHVFVITGPNAPIGN
jgi:L-lactate dehydrogenase complex protein LldG